MPGTNSIEEGESVRVDWKDKDYSAARLLFEEGNIDTEGFFNLPQMRINEITGREILKFCQGCDSLGSNMECRLGSQDQARYVARKFCGWASVDGVRGQMTDEGFKPF